MSRETLEFLLRRRSVKPAQMTAPGPTAADLDLILTAAARVPDHKKMVPWRFIVFEGEGRNRFGDALADVCAAEEKEPPSPQRLATERSRFLDAPLVIGVISRITSHPGAPDWEQELSAGAACFNLCLAANALGFATNWLTGWYAFSPGVASRLGLAANERVAGFIYVGTTKDVPEDRERPALADIVSRFLILRVTGVSMFYDALENKHGLPHDPLKALAVPRPIGWISTVSKSGIANLAPYSFFNAVAEKPAYVVFGSAGLKDSVANIEETGEFVCNIATYDLRQHMNMSSASVPRGVDEFPLAGLTAVKGNLVSAPRVKEAAAAFECKLHQVMPLPGAGKYRQNYWLVIGLVVGVHIDDRYIKDGRIDTGAMKPIARLGYMDYAVVTPETMFSINRPDVDEAGNVIPPKA